MLPEPILKQSTRVLYPSDYRAIRSHLNFKDQLILDGLLFSGMRGVEFMRFLESPEWYKPSRRAIDLPKGSMLKKKAKQAERTVLLSNAGVQAIETLISYRKQNPDEIRPISRQAWSETLLRGASKAKVEGRLGDLTGIAPKMTRKTWASWLIATHSHREGSVSLSLGHDIRTMLRHYAGLGWPADARQEIRQYTAGWGDE
ncbi:MAG: Site-specific recombinase, phage integrase family [Methanocalculus sp. 52_23]|nr:MAG: Site-specific recombinase, phage integrase family [Methanocalculus sp. 52_23]